MKILNIIGTAALAALLFSASHVTYAADPEKTELKFGYSPGPSPDLFLKAVKPILEKKGYKVSTVVLSDLILADLALNDKEIDFNVEQHGPFMEHFNETQDARLFALADIPTFPAGIYPGRKKDLKELEDGDHFAIPSDASNAARCLAIIQQAGLIKLDPNKNLVRISVNDIVENPRNLKFTELNSYSIPAVATDFDYILITSPIIYNIKADPTKAVFNETVQPYLMLKLVVHEDNKDKEWARDLVSAYASDELREYLRQNGNSYIYFPEK